MESPPKYSLSSAALPRLASPPGLPRRRPASWQPEPPLVSPSCFYSPTGSIDLRDLVVYLHIVFFDRESCISDIDGHEAAATWRKTTVLDRNTNFNKRREQSWRHTISFHDSNISPSLTFSMDDDDNNSAKIENKDLPNSDEEGKEYREKHTEIQEQVYQDKLAGIQKQLQQLRDGTHGEYVKQLKKLDAQHKNELMMTDLRRDCLFDDIEREFNKEWRLAHKEFEDRNAQLTETLISELNEKKKAIEHDNLNMELSPSSSNQKPAMTRKLRRRPNDPVEPTPRGKLRKPPPVSDKYFLLQEHEIEQDVKLIQDSLASIASTSTTITPTVKTRDTVNYSSIWRPGCLPSTSSSTASNMSPKKCRSSVTEGSSAIPNTRIEDGKLLFEKRWYHRGQPVFVEGRHMEKFPAVIHAIGNGSILVKKTSDNSQFCITLSYLSKGEMSIQRRAAV
ncbi:sin3 histone deacetylase corepressor complex component SDS3-like [Metopolophium dirhodum]|uniref:sin3 histone deacetylase corepressor complex component SDS3-like n=1 Tax=Metopolophium dirhodum TaxID=44670 RepID=UPI00298F988D|nr:sin3 histone deacetylase corepressor complex component SDS3-like [Metopolophium dirhodum]XP_060867432.1 sin3 histone deacetylase corepressor complex component SDS3-like [Metopolophium dirhodum]